MKMEDDWREKFLLNKVPVKTDFEFCYSLLKVFSPEKKKKKIENLSVSWLIQNPYGMLNWSEGCNLILNFLRLI